MNSSTGKHCPGINRLLYRLEKTILRQRYIFLIYSELFVTSEHDVELQVKYEEYDKNRSENSGKERRLKKKKNLWKEDTDEPRLHAYTPTTTNLRSLGSMF